MEKRLGSGKITVLPLFGLYCAYALWICLCDGADLLCYLTGLTQCTLLSRVLVTAVLLGIVWALRKHVELRSTEKDPLYYVLVLVILAFAIHKGIIVDTSADTNRYHILVQQPGFAHAMTEYLAAGDFQMFGFRLAERMFYPFRALLGYRLGTLLTGVAGVVAFSQVRALLHTLYGKRGGLISLIAFSVTMVSELIVQQGTYMVEVVAIPFALEALYLLLTEWDKRQSTGQMVWFAVLCGLFFACKMTHIVFAAPMVLLYLLLHRRDLTVGRFALAFVLAFAPVSICLLYNFAETGNPVFPYFNSLFQSPYFGTENFKDTRWGPSTLKELILWPYYSSTNPYYRLSEVPNQFVTGTKLYLLITGLTAGGLLLRRKKERPVRILLLVLAVTTVYLWAATTGHSRYYTLGYILTGLLVTDFLMELRSSGYKVLRLAAWLPLLVLLVQPWVLMESVSGGYEFAWRNSRDADRVSANLPYVLRDQGGAIADDSIPTPDLLLEIHGAFGGVNAVLYPDTPTVNYGYLQEHAGQAVQQEWLPKIQSALETDVVYETHFARNNVLEWKAYAGQLTELGIALETAYWPESIFDADDDVVLAKLGALPKGETNTVLYANHPEDSLTASGDTVRLQTQATMSRWNAIGEGVSFSVVATDGTTERTVYTAEIAMHETLTVDTSLDISGFAGDVRLQFRCSYENTDEVIPIECVVLNPKLS